MPGPDILFSWIHLSDIHFGHGDQQAKWSQKQVVGKLIADITSCLSRPANEDPPPAPKAIFVTGDIAQQGATEEYVQAGEWLRKLLAATQLSRRDLYLVPGNHDTRRAFPTQRQVLRLINMLRQGDPVDEALLDNADRAMLTGRQENYLRFARAYAPAALAGPSGYEQWLFWQHTIPAASDLLIHVVGLNTALLCNDDQDDGKLQLGSAQAQLPSREDKRAGELTMLLAHHPFSWLKDRDSEHVSSLVNVADLLLCGHVHRADALKQQRNSGQSIVVHSAGAVHEAPDSPAQGYRFGAIARRGDGKLEVWDWPRRWSVKRQRYERDSDNLKTDSEQHAAQILEHCLTKPHTMTLSRPTAALQPMSGRVNWDSGPAAGVDCIVDPTEARLWLSDLGLRPEDLLIGTVLLEPGGTAVVADPTDGSWRSGSVAALHQTMRQLKPVGVAVAMLHGVRGLGKTTLLLRYVADAKEGQKRFLVACSSGSEQAGPLARKATAELLAAVPQDSEVFIAVDGLDLACRDLAVVQRNPYAQKVLLPEVAEFIRLAERSQRKVTLVFAIDDAPDAPLDEDNWATVCVRSQMKESGGLTFQLTPSNHPMDGKVVQRILPGAWMPDPSIAAFLKYPIFFDSVRDRDPTEVTPLRTKMQFLEKGCARAERLGRRQHVYFREAADLRQFVEALRKEMDPQKESDQVRECIALIEPELTGEWMYLFDWEEDEKLIIRHRLDELYAKIIADSWRYSATFVMSNIVSLLDALGGLIVKEKRYEFCNLRNAQLLNKPKFEQSTLHGVDFRDARVDGGIVQDTVFSGADFRGVHWQNSQFKGDTRLIGCQFDAGIDLSAVYAGAQVIEPHRGPNGTRPG